MSLRRAFTQIPLAAALAFTAAAPALAQQALVPGESSIGFVSRQMGVPVEGQFRKFAAQVAFDPAKPAAAKGIYLRRIAVSSTMGAGVRVEPGSLSAA